MKSRTPLPVTAPARVLVVDDDVALAQFMGEVLTDARHAVTLCHGATEAMRALEHGAFDLVVTDLRMPGTTGMELIAWVKHYDSRIAVLAITAFGSIETAIQAVRLGAADYIPKPFEPDALLLAVNKSLRARAMQEELARLRTQVDERYSFDGVIARSAVMRDIVSFARRVSDSPSTVLLTGASGVGKEVLARAIHQGSRRRARPFVAINCAAVPDTLLESELFGYKKGAFTGATSDRDGLFREAHGGTLLLDEVGDLPLALQVKLLRVLQEREVRPVGATRSEPIDVRLIAATHRDLQKAIAGGTFREDLFYRLNVIEVFIPPLRDRADDIMPLAEHFLATCNARIGREIDGFSGAAARLLCNHAWPGNVRELHNAVERAVNLCNGAVIMPEDLPNALQRGREEDFLDRAVEQRMTISELEVAYARRVLATTGNNKKQAARLLGIDRRTLHRWIEGRDESSDADAGDEPEGS